MTKRQQKALQRYVDRLKPMLGLTDYEVMVEAAPPENPTHDGAHRSIPGTRCSSFRFTPKFFGFTPGYQREIVVHELLHCVFSPEQDQIRLMLPDHLTGKAGLVFRDMWFQAHEYAIDTIAVATGELFPLPPEFPR
jgi:hypothetical protein